MATKIQVVVFWVITPCVSGDVASIFVFKLKFNSNGIYILEYICEHM
jgi:phosphate/sulfate permease